jgi:hypothetical protein
MADLHHLLAIYVHAHQTGDSVPPHIDAEARAALAAAPPVPAPTINDIYELCEDHEFHLGGNGADEEESAESLLQIIRIALSRWGNQPPALDPREALAARPLLEAVVSLDLATWGEEVYNGRLPALQQRIGAWLAQNPPGQPVAIEPRGCPAPGACSCVEPPAPDHIRTATEMVGDGEREELAVELQQVADALNDEGLTGSARPVRRAAALLRQPAPAPVPVSERPWEREGWCDAEGRCWWSVPNQSWPCVYLMKVDSVLAAADEDAHCLPHWALPQPRQGAEVAE